MAKKNRWEAVSTTHWASLRDENVAEKIEREKEQHKPVELRPLTDGQAYYLRLIESKPLVVCTGPAGSGKSHMPCGYAARLLRSGQIKKIILTRPLVTCGQGMGFLPGDINEKTDPYMRPLFDLLIDFLGAETFGKYRKEGFIEVVPLEVMRGSTLKDAFIIADECQNATYEQLRMLLTRIGKNARMVLTGDASQVDLPTGNPLKEVIQKLISNPHKELAICQLTHKDVVRSGLARWLDERLGPKREEFIIGGEVNGYDTQGPLDTWYDCNCPKCNEICWFDDVGGASAVGAVGVEVIKCWRCAAHFCVPQDLDDISGYQVVAGGGCPSYPQKE